MDGMTINHIVSIDHGSYHSHEDTRVFLGVDRTRLRRSAATRALEVGMHGLEDPVTGWFCVPNSWHCHGIVPFKCGKKKPIDKKPVTSSGI